MTFKYSTAVVLALSLFLLYSFEHPKRKTRFYKIPAQCVDFAKIAGLPDTGKVDMEEAFDISELITYKEYKMYLAAVQKDSSAAFYQSQLPSKNIGSIEVWNTYIHSSDYDNEPVVGISLFNARNFCIWKTKYDNPDKNYRYRLPYPPEWLAAYYYLSTHNMRNDFNNQFADWTDCDHVAVNVKLIDYCRHKFFWISRHHVNHADSMSRVFVLGNSFAVQTHESIISKVKLGYVCSVGYKDVGFRYIREHKTKSETYKMVSPDARKYLIPDN